VIDKANKIAAVEDGEVDGATLTKQLNAVL